MFIRQPAPPDSAVIVKLSIDYTFSHVDLCFQGYAMVRVRIAVTLQADRCWAARQATTHRPFSSSSFVAPAPRTLLCANTRPSSHLACACASIACFGGVVCAGRRWRQTRRWQRQSARKPKPWKRSNRPPSKWRRQRSATPLHPPLPTL